MALWKILTEADAVTLTYIESVLPGGAPPKDCGRGDVALEADLEAFCIDQASPWDLIQSRRGVFVRQSAAFASA